MKQDDRTMLFVSGGMHQFLESHLKPLRLTNSLLQAVDTVDAQVKDDFKSAASFPLNFAAVSLHT